MSNITSTEAAGFIPEIWLQVALGRIRNYLTIQRLVTRDEEVQAGAFKVGDTLKLPRRGALVVNDKAENTNYTPQTPTADTVDVTLNKHKEVTFIVESRALSTTNQNVIQGYVEDGAMAIAEQIDTDLMRMFLSVPGSRCVGTNVAITETHILAARKNLVTAKVPAAMSKYGIVSPSQTNNLLQIDRLVRADAVGVGSNVAKGTVGDGSMPFESSIGRIHGINFMESQLVPQVTTADKPKAFQIVSLTGGPTGGTFTLTYSGQTTAAIAYNATAAVVQAALEALSNIAAGEVVVSGSAGAWRVEFVGTLAENTVAITGSGASLTGGSSPAVAIADATDGVSTKNLVFARDAILFASRELENPEQTAGGNVGVRSTVITDPQSGIALRLMHSYQHLLGGHLITLDVLYGFGFMRSEHINVIQTD